MPRDQTSPVPANTCIYCGRRGVSKEHVIPAWLGKYVSQNEPTNSLGYKLYGFGSRVIDEDHLERPGDGHTVKVRRVCESCNNGWMSQLQERAKPLILDMLSGAPLALHKRFQTNLAAWSAMTFMAGDFRRAVSAAISQEDRNYLMKVGRAPKNWRIWVGRYEREQAALLFAHNALRVSTPRHPVADSTDDELPPPNSQASSVIIGNIFLTCISSSASDLHHYWKFTPRNAALLDQIWPVETPRIAWPPERTMVDEDAVRIANTFFDGMMRYDAGQQRGD